AASRTASSAGTATKCGREGHSCMSRTLHLLLAGALSLIAIPVHADVFRCVSEGDEVLLTDRPCPAGYRTELVVESVEVPAPPPPAQAPGALPEGRTPAAAERPALDRLEEENRRLREALAQQRLERIEQRLDSLADRPD